MQVAIGIIIGVVMMCVIQSNKTSTQERKIEYLKKVFKTNSKGKSDYDKGYAAGIKYSYTILEEEM